MSKELTDPIGVSNPYRGLVLLVVLAFVALEFFWSRAKKQSIYNGKETGANFAILVGMQVAKVAFLGWQFFWLDLASKVSAFSLPDTLLTTVACFFVVEFCYYWLHRLMHEWKPLWAFHLVHHSSPWMNLTTSFRLNWFSPIVGIFFYLPAVMLGFAPKMIVIMIGLNLLFQFFLHTQAVGKLGFLEGIVNTPSSHRVHHGSNEIYLDKNYGGVLMIYDRLFGTYQPETEPVRYGITTGFISHNPFVLIFHGFYDLIRGRMTSKG